MRWLSCLTASLMLCSLTFKEKSNKDKPSLKDLNSKNGSDNLKKNIEIDLINMNIWKNDRYKLWVLAFPIALFGYFVPAFHLVKHVADILPTANGELLVTTIGATSGIGRLVFGQMADLKFVNPIVLQQIALIIMGSCTMLYSFSSKYMTIFIISALFGIFDGCFVSLLGPVVYNLVGQNGASQAIGFVLGFSSIPFIIGPAAAGTYKRGDVCVSLKVLTFTFVLSTPNLQATFTMSKETIFTLLFSQAFHFLSAHY